MHTLSVPGLDRRRRQLLGGAAALASLSMASVGDVLAAGQRIVSVGGALTETLFALGAQAELVGVDTTSLYPEAAKQLPNVGYQRTLSAEGVLSLAPTLLVATEDVGPPAVLRQIEAARIPVHVLDAGHSVEGLLSRTQRLADLTGRSAAGSALNERLRGQWQAARARVAALAPQDVAKAPRVLFLMVQAHNQMRAAGSGTAADALIAYAGARNALAGVQGYKTLSPEAAVAAAPDVIVTTDTGLATVGGAANLLRAPGLSQTPAGRAHRVVSIEILLALGFGPRLPLAVSTLAEAVHGRPAAG